MNRHTFLQAGAAAVFLPRLGSIQAATSRKPNVVVIYTDNQACEEMDCYGGKVSMPHMNRLAREGARFTRYYVYLSTTNGTTSGAALSS